MDEKSKDQRKRGVFSGREIFYFFFALLVFGVLVFILTEESSDRRQQAAEARQAKRDARLATAREAARAIERSGGYVLSDTQVFYHDFDGHPANPWLIYDLKRDAITNADQFVQALDLAGPYRDTLTNWGLLSGRNGNLVFTTHAPGFGTYIFQWRTNSDELQVFKWSEFGGTGRFATFAPMMAAEDGWFFGQAYNKPPSGKVSVTWAGNLGEIMRPTTIVLTNLNKTNLVVSCPFRRDLYITIATTDRLYADFYIFSLTNQSLTYSNEAVKMPRAFDYVAANPDPSGKRVLWTFAVESKINAKLRSVLPSAIAPEETPTKWYLYSSDLHATRFRYIEEVKADYSGPNFIWGVNGDSIWLLDNDEGIKRVELK